MLQRKKNQLIVRKRQTRKDTAMVGSSQMPEALAAYRTCPMDAPCANVPDDEGGSPDFLKGRLLSDGRASNGCAQNSKKNACVWHMPEK